MTPQPHIEQQLGVLRERAAARERVGRTLDGAMLGMQRRLGREAKRFGGAAEAWAQVCPAQMLSRTAILGLSRGELRIAIADSATMYELDRFLRAGGEMEFARQSSAPIHRVKLVLDARPFRAEAGQ